MKKKMMLVIAGITAMLSLTACGKFECDMCGEEKSGKSYTVTVMGDEEVTICDDCYKTVKELMDAIN